MGNKDNEQNQLTSGQKRHYTRAVNAFREEASKLINELEKLRDSLNEEDENGDSILDRLVNLEALAAKKTDEIDQFYHSIFTPPAPNKFSVDDEIQEFLKEFKNSQKEISELFEEITEFKEELFGDKSSDIEENKKGIAEKIRIYEGMITDSYIKNKNKQNKLFEEIEGLLKGASTVALAKAFNEHKNSFIVGNWIWLVTFVLSLAAIMLLSVWSYNKTGIEFIDMWKVTLGNLPYIGAAVWLAIYASKQRSQNKRLQQEYAYKEDVAKIYYGLKKEIEELGDSDLGKQLNEQVLGVIVETVALNPSSTLEHKSHDDKGPMMEVMSKLTESVDKLNKN